MTDRERKNTDVARHRETWEGVGEQCEIIERETRKDERRSDGEKVQR